jgi:glutamate/tyrosine decarboxylase-like PLP-dependent enzyme
MAHFTCLAAARHAVLQRTGWDLARDGMSGAPAIRLFMSDQRHSTIDRAARYLGFGTRNLQVLPTDEAGRLAPETLSKALAAWSGPSIVVLNAADLNIAAFDAFEELIPIARAANAWVHIDGAFGLVARASRAEAWPDGGSGGGGQLGHRRAQVAQRAVRLRHCGGARPGRASRGDDDQRVIPGAGGSGSGRARLDTEFSRRGRGYTVYAAIRELGREGLEALVDRCCEHCRSIVTGIGGLEGAEALWVSS